MIDSSFVHLIPPKSEFDMRDMRENLIKTSEATTPRNELIKELFLSVPGKFKQNPVSPSNISPRRSKCA